MPESELPRCLGLDENAGLDLARLSARHRFPEAVADEALDGGSGGDLGPEGECLRSAGRNADREARRHRHTDPHENTLLHLRPFPREGRARRCRALHFTIVSDRSPYGSTFQKTRFAIDLAFLLSA